MARGFTPGGPGAWLNLSICSSVHPDCVMRATCMSVMAHHALRNSVASFQAWRASKRPRTATSCFGSTCPEASLCASSSSRRKSRVYSIPAAVLLGSAARRSSVACVQTRGMLCPSARPPSAIWGRGGGGGSDRFFSPLFGRISNTLFFAIGCRCDPGLHSGRLEPHPAHQRKKQPLAPRATHAP